MKSKLECRTQIDCKDFEFERFELFVEFATRKTLNWLRFKSKCRIKFRDKDFNLWDLIDQSIKREEDIFICMLLRLFLDQFFVLLLSYRDFWCFDVLNDVQFFESIETTTWIVWCSRFSNITRRTCSLSVFKRIECFDYWWFWCLTTQYWNWFDLTVIDAKNQRNI